MHWVAAKFVPRLLSEEQQRVRYEVAEDLLQTCDAIPDYLDTIITGDETWVYGYDPETKAQSSQWKHPSSPRPTKACQVRSKTKVMLTVFFYSRGIVHHEFAPEDQTVTKEYSREVLRRLREAVRRKRRNLWESKNWRLHHDNAPVHTSLMIADFLKIARSPISLFSRHGPSWLLVISKHKASLEGPSFLEPRNGYGERDDGAEGYPRRRIPGVLRKMEGTLDKMCQRSGSLFRRTLKDVCYLSFLLPPLYCNEWIIYIQSGK